MPTSPEVKKRVALRKLESEVRAFTPCMYKNDMLQPNFAEALRILYLNTKPLNDLLSETICSDDQDRNYHFLEQLILTGFSQDSQHVIDSLSYTKRKENAMNADSLPRFFEREHAKLEKVIEELKSPQFAKIDKVIDNLRQLHDICHYSYITPLKLFDTQFNSNPAYSPRFNPIPLGLIEAPLQDLYYILADMDINTSTSNALRALMVLKNKGQLDTAKEIEMGNCLRMIQGTLKTVFKTEFMLKLVKLAKGNPELEPEKASYTGGDRKRYADYLENRFIIDESRLKNEIQDENISREVQELFGDRKLEVLKGYNTETNNLLKLSTPCSFFWIQPMQVLKTFIIVFFQNKVRSLLNDIAIEGFFNVPDYKTEFSSEVYAVNDTLAHIEAFEKQFEQGEPFDEDLISSLIQDSHKDDSFLSRLKMLVDKIEKEAKTVLQIEASKVYHLAEKVSTIAIEAKKPTSDIVTNLKVLTMSSRNRDNYDFLDKTADRWKIFLDIMKEYVILTKNEKKK